MARAQGVPGPPVACVTCISGDAHEQKVKSRRIPLQDFRWTDVKKPPSKSGAIGHRRWGGGEGDLGFERMGRGKGAGNHCCISRRRQEGNPGEQAVLGSFEKEKGAWKRAVRKGFRYAPLKNGGREGRGGEKFYLHGRRISEELGKEHLEDVREAPERRVRKFRKPKQGGGERPKNINQNPLKLKKQGFNREASHNKPGVWGWGRVM